MDTFFQVLACDALRSFKDNHDIDINFSRLAHGLRYEPCVWDKFFPYASHRSLPKPRPSSLYSTNSESTNDSACNSLSASRTASRTNSRSDSSSDSGCEGRSSGKDNPKASLNGNSTSHNRWSVKDRRLMFERQVEHPDKENRCDPCRSSLKRTVSLKERKKFWENLAAKSSKETEGSNINRICFIKKRKLASPEAEKEVKHIQATTAQPTRPSSASRVASSDDERPMEVTTTPEPLDRPDQIHPIKPLDIAHEKQVSSSQESLESRGHSVSTSAPSPSHECKNMDLKNMDLKSCELSKQDLIFTSSAQQSGEFHCDTGSWVEVQTEPTFSRPASGFIDDEIDEYGSFIGGLPPPDQELGGMPRSPGFQLSNQMGKMLGVDPSRVTAYGQGLKAGFVNKDSSFRVWTGEGGPGFLTVGIQECVPGTLRKITTSQLVTEAAKKGLWEVTYQVTQPGYYVIFVRWSDCNISGSPFVAQITDPAAIC